MSFDDIRRLIPDQFKGLTDYRQLTPEQQLQLPHTVCIACGDTFPMLTGEELKCQPCLEKQTDNQQRDVFCHGCMASIGNLDDQGLARHVSRTGHTNFTIQVKYPK